MQNNIVSFVTMGDNCPEILNYAFKRLHELYPAALIYFYDWGLTSAAREVLKTANPNVSIIRWPGANRTNYTREKVRCILDCYKKHHKSNLVYFDSDVVIAERIDEVWDGRWDVGVTWRPEFKYRRDIFPNGPWINSGVIFMKADKPRNTCAFLERFAKRCIEEGTNNWYVDQIELISLCDMADVDLSTGAGIIGTIRIGSCNVKCKTFNYNVYNFLPFMPVPYKLYYEARPKIIHFKNDWRKQMFHQVPSCRQKAFIRWIINLGKYQPIRRLFPRLARYAERAWYNFVYRQ